MRLAPALALVVIPTLAAAEPSSPWTAGVNLGLTQSEKASQDDANTMLALYGRYRFTPRLAAQLEVGTLRGDSDGSFREATGLIAVDLLDGHRLVPIIVAGFGFDWYDNGYGESTNAHHFEGGLGVEYRVDNGFVVGADARLGGRSIDSDTTVQPQTGRLYFAPLDVRDGEYRSVRVTMGIHF